MTKRDYLEIILAGYKEKFFADYLYRQFSEAAAKNFTAKEFFSGAIEALKEIMRQKEVVEVAMRNRSVDFDNDKNDFPLRSMKLDGNTYTPLDIWNNDIENIKEGIQGALVKIQEDEKKNERRESKMEKDINDIKGILTSLFGKKPVKKSESTARAILKAAHVKEGVLTNERVKEIALAHGYSGESCVRKYNNHPTFWKERFIEELKKQPQTK